MNTSCGVNSEVKNSEELEKELDEDMACRGTMVGCFHRQTS